MSTPRNTLIKYLLAGVVLGAAAGCTPAPDQEKAAGDATVAPPRASVTLRVAFVSDESLRRTIDRLRGEWRELTGGEVETRDVPADADLVAAAKEADLLVFPSRAIGELCEAAALLPVRPSVLKSPSLRFEDFLPLVRDHEVVYAQQVFALPLGCPPPLLLAPEGKTSTGLALPEGDADLALVYLAWSAPHAVHRSRTTTLFDSDDFSPRLAQPPFVRALESLAKTSGEGPATIAWPQREAPLPGGLVPQPLPGAAENYNPIAEAWEPLPKVESHATLVASRGRLVGVTSSTRNAATAFRYAAWLAGPENSRLVSTSSDSVANCRGSLARASDPWRKSEDADLGKRFAEAAADSLRNPRHLLAPRLAGSEEYLEVLGKHVREALAGAPAEESLQKAADAWESLSKARGREAQCAAYARSINAAPFPEERR